MTSIKSFALSTVQIVFLLFFSQSLYAHTGHDHSHWSSDLLHILFYAAIAVAAVGIVYATVKRSSKTDNPTV